MREAKCFVQPLVDDAGDGPSVPEAKVASLQEELRALSARHRLDLEACVQRWAQGLQQQPLEIAVPSKVADAPCEPAALGSMRCAAPGSQPRAGSTSTELPEASARQSSAASPASAATPPEVEAKPKAAAATVAAADPDTPLKAAAAAKELPAVEGETGKDSRTRSKRSNKAATHHELIPQQQYSVDKWSLDQITRSSLYEALSATLIILNALFIGVQSQYSSSRAEAVLGEGLTADIDAPLAFVILQVLFTVLFALELAPRWVRDGFLGFFRADERWWNVLDVTVVGFGIIDMLFLILVVKMKVLRDLSIIRVLRVLRIVRVARVIRIMKFFRELRLMVYSIMRSMKALMWVILVLGLMFYVFGIMFTEATVVALDTPQSWTSPDTLDLRLSFGTLDRSVLSLFMAMSGGNDWSTYYTALQLLPVQYSLMFLLYISFAVFAVVNIVTGVFVESALQSNSDDMVVTAHDEMETKKEYIEAMRAIFYEMDQDESGEVTIEEFEQNISDERVAGFFRAMKLDVSDARKLFWLLDNDGSNKVDIDEFVSGCYKLQGESRALDLKLMQLEVSALRESLGALHGKLHHVLCQPGSAPAIDAPSSSPDTALVTSDTSLAPASELTSHRVDSPHSGFPMRL